jgi:hypothetical protein
MAAAMNSRIVLAVFSSWVIASCKVRVAPKDESAFASQAWDSFSDDIALVEVGASAYGIFDMGKVDEPNAHIDGRIESLKSTQIASLAGLEGSPDPAAANGFFMMRRVACSFDEMAQLLSSPNQASLYEGKFVSFNRTFEGDQAAFANGAEKKIGFLTRSSANANGTVYDAELAGVIRRVQGMTDSKRITGRLLALRQYFVRPATVPGDNRFPQDYQLELFLEEPEGSLLHFFAVWRDVSISGYDTSSDLVLSLVISKMASFDTTSESWCKKGVPR